MTNETPSLEEIRKSLEKEKVMVVDPGATSRAALFKAFSDLGVKPGNINLIDSFQNAIVETSFSKSKIVIAEYNLGRQCGLELLQQLRAKHPKEAKNILFMIVASNTSQTAVAEATLFDSNGKLYGSSTTTCLIFDIPQ